MLFSNFIKQKATYKWENLKWSKYSSAIYSRYIISINIFVLILRGCIPSEGENENVFWNEIDEFQYIDFGNLAFLAFSMNAPCITLMMFQSRKLCFCGEKHRED